MFVASYKSNVESVFLFVILGNMYYMVGILLLVRFW